MDKVIISELMEKSGVKFGTSGARGLVSDMTDRVCYAYTLAFLNYLESKGLISKGMEVAVAGDYRPSSPRIMKAVGLAVQQSGYQSICCGFVPTPAVALFGMVRGIASIMVTGSHIPDDRNGIKFYKPEGEILKDDELGMCSRSVEVSQSLFDENEQMVNSFKWGYKTTDAYHEFVQRYVQFFPENCLKDKRVGVYEHSSVARDILGDVMSTLGAEVVCLGRSEKFIPVDTEAVREEDIQLAQQWSVEHGLDCIVSADGDGDRPLVSDEFGHWLRGDVAGILCASFLKADAVVTPVSCNSAVEKSELFQNIERTKIGSPFVIEGMNKLLKDQQVVVGYEANGGFLTATDIRASEKTLLALPTRDAVIVPLAILMVSIAQGVSISSLLKSLPCRFTSSGRIQNFPTALSEKQLKPLQNSNESEAKKSAERLFEEKFGQVKSIDITDGVRITFDSDEIVHLRPSGNAPELRCYTEAASEARAESILSGTLKLLECWL